jgi:hypothetical protein
MNCISDLLRLRCQIKYDDKQEEKEKERRLWQNFTFSTRSNAADSFIKQCRKVNQTNHEFFAGNTK